MRDLLEEYQSLAAHGPVGRAVVTRVWGSAPRGPGGCLLATTTGEMAGSVSGGCVEGAAVQGIQQAIAEGRPRIMSWSVTHEQAWEVGLACGGTIEVLVEPVVRAALLDAAASEAGSVIATPLAGPAFG
ncbi:MAG: XdhC family protein, partial [Gemmatimonadales bacterium]